MTDHATLRRLAEAATPGPWHRHTYGHLDVRSQVRSIGRALRAGEWASTDLTWLHADGDDGEGQSVALVGNGPRQVDNGDYLAALDPQTVLALLDRIEALEEALPTVEEMARAVHATLGYGAPRLAEALLALLRAQRGGEG